MRGFGQVYERFCAEGDFQDDEVALLHEPAPSYRPLSEPLVHLRAAVDYLVARGLLGERQAHAVVSELKTRWYGERTLRGAVEVLARLGRPGLDSVRDELARFDRFRIKTTDLERFLIERPWRREWTRDSARDNADRPDSRRTTTTANR